MPRRIEVPSADALFGGPAGAPAPPPPARPRRRAAPEAAAAPRAQPTARRRRRAAAPAPADEGVLRRLDQLEAVLVDLSVDRLIELREGLEVLLAAGTVDAAALHHLLDLTAAGS